jgi:hypothetical protein
LPLPTKVLDEADVFDITMVDVPTKSVPLLLFKTIFPVPVTVKVELPRFKVPLEL